MPSVSTIIGAAFGLAVAVILAEAVLRRLGFLDR